MKKIMAIKNQKGASAVEFAIVFPLLLVFMFGIIEFGLLLYNKAMITNAAREGARLGIVYDYDPNAVTYHASESEIQNVVVTYAKAYLITFGSDTLETTDVEVCVNGVCPGDTLHASSGDKLTVKASYKYNFLVFPNVAKLVKGSFTNDIDLNVFTVMRFE